MGKGDGDTLPRRAAPLRASPPGGGARRDVTALLPARRRDAGRARGPRALTPRGRSRPRDAAGLHRPPQLPGPGARRGALLQGLRQDSRGGSQERVSAGSAGLPRGEGPGASGPWRGRGGRGRRGLWAVGAARGAGSLGSPWVGRR